MVPFLFGVLMSISLALFAGLIRYTAQAGPSASSDHRSFYATIFLVLSVLVMAITMLQPLMHTFVSAFLYFPLRLLQGPPSHV